MSLAQDNGTFIKYHTDKQANFFLSTTLFGGELVGGVLVSRWWVGWWRDGFSVASWLVAKLPGGEMTGYRDKGSRQ